MSASQGCILIRRIKIRPYEWCHVYGRSSSLEGCVCRSLNPGSATVGKVTHCIDGAGGTGDIALRILERKADRDLTVDVVDVTLTSSKRARNASARPCTTRVRDSTPPTRVLHTHSFALAPQVAFYFGNAQQLDPEEFPDNTHDLYTI